MYMSYIRLITDAAKGDKILKWNDCATLVEWIEIKDDTCSSLCSALKYVSTSGSNCSYMSGSYQ